MNCGLRLLVSCLGLLLGLKALAQSEPRFSLSGPDAALARSELRQREDAASTDLRLGPTHWNLSTGIGLECNSNIGLDPSGKERLDFVWRPRIGTEMRWPVTEANQVRLKLGIGYTGYTSYQQYNRWFISPGSELGFDLYVGKVWIEAHDRLRVATENYLDPTVANLIGYAELRNEVGLSALWDLNAIRFRLGADHINQVRLSGSGDKPSGHQDLFWCRIGHANRDGNEVGIESGGGWRDYDTHSFPADQGTQWNAGLYWDGAISQYIRARASIGHMEYYPEDDTDVFRGMYGQLELAHRLNPWVRYTLNCGRQLTTSLFSGTLDYYRAGLQTEWSFIRQISLGAGFTYENGQGLAAGGEDFERYGASLSLGRMITQKLRASARYQYYQRLADTAQREYQAHIGELRLGYEF